jgi:NTP pyrophosphatase (non-canonical NTP hydrolase)
MCIDRRERASEEPLRQAAALREIHMYVAALEREWGFEQRSAVDQCLKLLEEAGELSRAVDARSGQPIDPRPADPMSPTN